MAAAITEQALSPRQGNDITFMDMVDELESLGESKIKGFLAGATVFMTGGTGFLGKLLLEKLLRTCPDIKKVYFLARPKKDKEIQKRLQEQFSDALYEKLKKEQPNFIEKIGVIEGDLELPDIGVSKEDKALLHEEVDLIFHVAATVKFDESIKKAVAINIRASREMLKIARNCKNLRAFVHTSTAYSNCPHKTIEEKFYPTPMPADSLIDLIENVDEKILDKMTKDLIGDHPNTYVYTKAVAENAILKYGKGLPVTVVRPSIIIGTARDPIAGWIDNIYGPTGVVVGATLGLLHTMQAKRSAKADLVPGDMVVNTLISAAWKVSLDFRGNTEDVPAKDADPTIYNFVSGPVNPINWDKFLHLNEEYGFQTPPVKTMWVYLLLINETKAAHMFWSLFLHWIPAYIVDGGLMLIGKKPMLRKAYTKIAKFSGILSYFATSEWNFVNDNTQQLFKSLAKADQHIYGFDLAQINWNDYFSTYVKGLRIYLLQDPMETVPEGLSRMRKLKVIHYSIMTVLSLISLKLCWVLLSLVMGY